MPLPHQIIPRRNPLRSGLTRKIFTGLVAIAMLPLLAVTLASRSGLYSAAETLGTRGEELIRSMVVDNVVSTAWEQAWTIDLVGESLTMGADYLTNQVQTLAAAPTPNATLKALGVFTERDFRSQATAPPDAMQEEEYKPEKPQTSRMGMGMGMGMGMMGRRPLSGLVSYSEPSFYFPPSGNRKQMQADARRLAAIDGRMQRLRKLMGDNIYRMFITLKSGIHIAYPGFASSQPHYDPRRSPEYRMLADGGKGEWVGPMIDPATGRVVLSLITPVYTKDKHFAGITGITLLVSDILDSKSVTAQWSANAKMFLAGLQTTTSGQNELLVYAKRDYVRQNGMRHGWQEPIKIEPLVSNDRKALDAFLSSVQKQDVGHAFMPFQGVESVWAFAAVDKSSQTNLVTVLIVPATVTEELPMHIRTMVQTELARQAKTSGAIALLVVAGLFLLAIFVSKRFTRPLHAMADTAAKMGEGDFSARINMTTGDERDIVINTLNDMGPRLEESLRVKGALDIAHEVQQRLLPNAAPSIPGFDISGASRYSDETGGDYFDFFTLGDNSEQEIAIAVGDVSGHGIGAALLMASARASLRASCTRGVPPATAISTVNALLAKDLIGSGRFMTLFYMELLSGGRLRWVRAGHDPALLYLPNRDTFDELGGDGMVLGVIEHFDYEEQCCQSLEAGAIVVIGTDGIWEATDANDEMFGKHRLREIIRREASGSAEQIRNAVMQAVEVHIGSAEILDDLTLVVMKKTDYTDR